MTLADTPEAKAIAKEITEHQFNTIPVPNVPFPDYGLSVTGIENAMMELREGLPAGQTARCRRAMQALLTHTQNLRLWLEHKTDREQARGG